MLLFERIYPSIATAIQKAEMKEAAILISEYLGIKVVSKEGEGEALISRSS